MVKYWLTGKLNLLIHPDYFWLVITGGIGLLIVTFFQTKLLLKKRREILPEAEHMNVFPPGWSSSILLITAIAGLLITPQVFASDKAMTRSVSELLGPTRSQPQSFRATTRPEERTLIEWVRTLSVYPEPDKYTGQKAKIQGFVIHPQELSQNFIMLSRFVITCCAADAYPIGLPVKLSENREKYKPDSWLEIEGKMITENIAGKRHLAVEATSLKPIPQPQNPYSY
ncbi:MAG: TIGR03943 family protein [Calothrix sp. SM1_7_51]|nr:TIGR03943 family protein [Calothrix sp. SM1_7_51]